MLAFITPYNDNWSWIVEPIIVVFYFPLIVALGSVASLSSKHYTINKLSGDISYPLYMTHYPFMWVFANYVATKQPTSTDLGWVIPISVLLLIGFGYVVTYFVDFSIRRYLTNKLKSSAALQR